MARVEWQKSSFSEGGADTCVEVTLDPVGHLRLRESDTPGTALTSAPSALAALLDRVKDGTLSGS